MKKHLTLAAFIFIAACSKTEEPVTPDPEIKVTPISLSFGPGKNLKDSFFVDFPGAWTATIEPFDTKWLELSKTSGTGPGYVVLTTLENNLSLANRGAMVSLRTPSGTGFARVTLGQTPYITQPFANTMGGSESDVFNASAATDDGGYISVGYTNSANGDINTAKGGNDVLVVRFDAAGDMVWRKTFGGAGDEMANAIVSTSVGYFIVGQTASSSGDFPASKGDHDFFLLHMDGIGNKVFSKTYGGSLYDAAFSIAPTLDNNFLIAGSTHSLDGDVTGQHVSPTRTPVDAWVLKVGRDGSLIWNKCYGSTSTEAAMSAVSTGDGGYAIVAYSDAGVAEGDIVQTKGSLDIVLFKTNASGQLQWSRTFGGSQVDFPFSLRISPNGGFVIGGYTMSNDQDISGLKGSTDGLLIKTSENGSLEWAKTYGTAGPDAFHSIIATPSGYRLAGNVSTSTQGDGWMLQVNTDGTVQAEKKYGGNGADQFKHILNLSNGFHLLTGFTQSTDLGLQQKGKEDAYLVRASD